MSNRCKTCDRAECDAAAATAAYYAVPWRDRTPAEQQDVSERHHAAVEECQRNRVDWRERCLAAEQEREELQAFIEGEAARTADACNAVVDSIAEYIDARWFVDLAEEVRARRWSDDVTEPAVDAYRAKEKT